MAKQKFYIRKITYAYDPDMVKFSSAMWYKLLTRQEGDEDAEGSGQAD